LNLAIIISAIISLCIVGLAIKYLFIR
jgi:hypothetical protein